MSQGGARNSAAPRCTGAGRAAGFGRGTGIDCSSGNFPAGACGSSRCRAGVVSGQIQPGDCGSAALGPQPQGLVGNGHPAALREVLVPTQHRAGGDRNNRGVSGRTATGITDHLRCMGWGMGFGSATDVRQSPAKRQHPWALPPYPMGNRYHPQSQLHSSPGLGSRGSRFPRSWK